MLKSNNMEQYIYLSHEYRFIKKKIDIYKLSKTIKQHYSNNSKLMFQCICDKCDSVYTKLINIFSIKYIQQKDIGTEYFKGNFKDMIIDIYSTIIDSNDIKINSFDKYLKYSINISNIVITDTQTLEGYIKFKNCLWKKINNIDSISDNLVYFLDNNITYPINKNSLISDICKKCYNNNPSFYTLSPNEYIIRLSKHDYILNVKTFMIKNCGIDIDYKILIDTNKYLSHIFVSNDSYIKNIDTNIVDNILNSLIQDENIIINYKNLCYNTIVEQKDTIIFEDYSYTNHLLTNWLKCLLNRLTNKTAIYFDDIEKNNYVHYFNIIKPKLVIINGKYLTKNIIDENIKLLIELDIKNIIILYSNKCMYKYDTYSKFLIDNREYISSLFMSSNIKHDYTQGDYDDIFYFSYMLSNNYLKWCCNIQL